MAQWKAPDNTALIIVDIQNDFCPKGKLAVNEGNLIIPIVNSLRQKFKTVVLTQDFHPEGHKSFASSHEDRQDYERVWMKDGIIVGEILTDQSGNVMDQPQHAPVVGAIVQTLWPEHCVQGTIGADFHEDLLREDTDLILQKGTNKNIDSYSGFFENDGKTRPLFTDGRTLRQMLSDKNIDRTVFVGLAGDFCVGWHALDSVKENFNAVVAWDATRSIAIPMRDGITTETCMLDEMKQADVQIIQSNQLHTTLRRH